MKIMIVLPNLRHGGSERVAANIANFWAAQGKTVVVTTFEAPTRHDYPLRSEVEQVSLAFPGESVERYGTFLKLARRLWTFRRIVRTRAPDVVIGFMPSANVLVALACFGLKCRTIGSERAHPPQMPLMSVWKMVRRLTYRLLSVVVAQTRDTADWLRTNTSAGKIAIIPNPIKWPIASFEPVVAPGSICPAGRKILLAVGRLDHQKGFSHLLNAFAEISRTRPDWSLVILGDGPLRSDLRRQAEAAGIADRVLMPGYVGNVADWYQRASLFVLSSLFEGFPNVLAEAMAAGLPAVSFDCDTGPRDIVRSGIDGLLVPNGDVAAMSQALARLMDDEALRKQMAMRAVDVRETLSEPVVMRSWEQLFAEI